MLWNENVIAQSSGPKFPLRQTFDHCDRLYTVELYTGTNAHRAKNIYTVVEYCLAVVGVVHA
jgi:hypothetical protein